MPVKIEITRERKSHGFCGCGRLPAFGRETCDLCFNKNNRGKFNFRKRCIEQGLCVHCGKEKSTNWTPCNKCAQQLAHKRDVLRSLGLCVKCGKARDRVNRKWCKSCQEKTLKHHDKHFFKRRAGSQNSRPGIDGKITAIDLFGLWKQQKGKCALTGVTLTVRNSAVDHIVPNARGGPHDKTNLRWTTQIINKMKGDLTDEEFREQCAAMIEFKG